MRQSGISVTEQIEAGYQNDCIKDIMRLIHDSKDPGLGGTTPGAVQTGIRRLPEDVNLQKSTQSRKWQSTGTVPWYRKKSIRSLKRYDLPRKTVSTICGTGNDRKPERNVQESCLPRAADTEDVTLADIGDRF